MNLAGLVFLVSIFMTMAEQIFNGSYSFFRKWLIPEDLFGGCRVVMVSVMVSDCIAEDGEHIFFLVHVRNEVFSLGTNFWDILPLQLVQGAAHARVNHRIK